jgi:hypothetical protein
LGRYIYIALTRAKEGREAELDQWYDEQHLGDVARVPGVVEARRFDMVWQKSEALDAPAWRSLAIYEIESDDPQSVLEEIHARSGTELMPLSDAIDRNGMTQLLAAPAKPAKKS